jgi:hypothetical protein
VFGLFALIFALAGCGPDTKARGVVKGRVTSNKKPLTTGTVMFYGNNGVTAAAPINTKGEYEMNDAPLGECRIVVIVQGLPMDPDVRARLKGGGPKVPEVKNPEESTPALPSNPQVPKEVVPVDARYSKPETSGLTFTVEKGEQTHNIDL